VVWNFFDGAGYGVDGRVLDASGAPFGSEFAISTYMTGSQRKADVAPLSDGNFVVVWEGPGSTDPSGVFGRRIDVSSLALVVDGVCGATVTAHVRNAPPNSEVAIVAAANANGFVKGGALCNGTELEIGEPFNLPPTFLIVDENGNGSTNLSLAANRCHVQALAFATCETSNVVAVP
jgi:hypothetical protein